MARFVSPEKIMNSFIPCARLYALVPCAGVGARAGFDQPKQYAQLGVHVVVEHTLRALLQVSRLTGIWVVLHAQDAWFQRVVSHEVSSAVRVVPAGGTTRAETVLAGLRALQSQGADPHDWVLVHDAARALIQPAWVDRLIDACVDDPVGGLLACPVADTLKQEEQGRATATYSREHKWQAQTPQMFRLGVLQSALSEALTLSPHLLTDEASAIERLGLSPQLVQGEMENFKLTYPSDFALAQRLLKTSPLSLI
jgi:2-C-methyl-D-erythritol 4-phosphate cytidylyltransferase